MDVEALLTLLDSLSESEEKQFFHLYHEALSSSLRDVLKGSDPVEVVSQATLLNKLQLIAIEIPANKSMMQELISRNDSVLALPNYKEPIYKNEHFVAKIEKLLNENKSLEKEINWSLWSAFRALGKHWESE